MIAGLLPRNPKHPQAPPVARIKMFISASPGTFRTSFLFMQQTQSTLKSAWPTPGTGTNKEQFQRKPLLLRPHAATGHGAAETAQNFIQWLRGVQWVARPLSLPRSPWGFEVPSASQTPNVFASITQIQHPPTEQPLTAYLPKRHCPAHCSASRHWA
jgi:hypothetical protein